MKNLTACVLGSIFVLGSALLSCGMARSYRLATPAAEAKATFPGIGACATKGGLESVQHPESLNVKFDSATWVQFMVQGDAYNMVVLVGDEVPEGERDARSNTAKLKGDELFACALANPIAAPPPAQVAAPIAPIAPVAPAEQAEPAEQDEPAKPVSVAPAKIGGGGCISATEMACTQDHQCPTKNCSSGYCQNNDPGSLCGQDYHCTTKNCTNGCCQTNDVGAACGQDYHCTSKNCTGGQCQSNAIGAACGQDYHCTTKNCSGGQCQGNTRGSACGQDYHCTSKNCTGGTCQ